MASAEAAQSRAVGGTFKGKETSLWADAVRRLFHNKAAVVGLVIIAIMIVIYILADVIAPYSFATQVSRDANKVPQWMISLFPFTKGYAKVSTLYPLGTDDLGRDLFSRVVYGTRVSLSIAFLGPLLAMIIGTVYGGVSGYFGGRVDEIMMRIVDIMYAFPTLLLIILLMAFFRSSFAGLAEPGTLRYTMNALDAKMGGLLFIFIGISLTSWMGAARLTRGQVLSVREKEFIEAARSIGSNDRQIMWRHILPNILGPLIVAETLAIPAYISYEAFLSFIGLGVNPPTPSWGIMIADGARSIRSYPHIVLFPAIALALTMFAFNFLGDGLRDALDPRMRGTR